MLRYEVEALATALDAIFNRFARTPGIDRQNVLKIVKRIEHAPGAFIVESVNGHDFHLEIPRNGSVIHLERVEGTDHWGHCIFVVKLEASSCDITLPGAIKHFREQGYFGLLPGSTAEEFWDRCVSEHQFSPEGRAIVFAGSIWGSKELPNSLFAQEIVYGRLPPFRIGSYARDEIIPARSCLFPVILEIIRINNCHPA